MEVENKQCQNKCLVTVRTVRRPAWYASALFVVRGPSLSKWFQRSDLSRFGRPLTEEIVPEHSQVRVDDRITSPRRGIELRHWFQTMRWTTLVPHSPASFAQSISRPTLQFETAHCWQACSAPVAVATRSGHSEHQWGGRAEQSDGQQRVTLH